jgi:hypothetical protein
MDARSISNALAAATSQTDDDAILEKLRADPQAAVILEQLSRDRDLEIRGWVPEAARRILGTDALPLLLRLFRDRDPDIRGLALAAIEALDPALVESLLVELRRRLSSKDRDEVIAIAWRLAARSDQASIPLIEAFRDRHEPWEGNHKVASVILLLMSAPEEIRKRIDAHDHDHMLWLPYAAILSGRREALEAVWRCAAAGPDDVCRRFCRYSLEKYASEISRS